MRRARLFLLIAVGVAVFLVISALLSRVLSLDGAERAAITSLVQAEARGDARGMSGEIRDCAASPSATRCGRALASTAPGSPRRT